MQVLWLRGNRMTSGMSSAADVIVLGGGVVGLSAARALAAEGARVLLVERGRVGEEASGAAAGMLTAQADTAAGSRLLETALLSRARHAALALELEQETGISVERSARGVLEVAFAESEEAVLRDRAGWQRARGLSVETLSGGELREAEPNLSPAVRSGLYFADDRAVDNVRLVRALAASAVARGATLLCGRPVTSLVLERGRVAGVWAGPERLSAPVVLNAIGAWASQLPGDPQPPPVEPVRGHIVAFELTPRLLRHVVCSHRGYLVPRGDGRLLAGSTVERAGFDKSVTAGALHAVLAIALEIAPKLADVPIAESWAGLRPGTPDGLPVVGRGAVEGLIHAAGLFRNGILLGPLIGEAAARLALGRDPGIDLSAFDPARFTG
jgi:glycine oxidase